jgi:DNA repair exonuclease SbcCD nuclease subunit
MIVCKGVKIYNQPQWLEFDDSTRFLLVPYQNHRHMGEIIQEQLESEQLDKDWWGLIGHGDWFQSVRTINPYEPGVYMPLTRRDMQLFNPDLVFLGHIHDHRADGNVYYPGSPVGMDITETGYRNFLIFDTKTKKVEPIKIQSAVLYFHLDLVVLPLENEEDYLQQQIRDQIESWNLDEGDVKKVQLRVVVKGYSTNREKIQKTIYELLSKFSLYDEPKLNNLFVANDQDRNYISQKLLEGIEGFELKDGPDEPDKTMVIMDAMRLIYGD